MPPLPAALAPLERLNSARRPASEYYAPLFAGDDEILRIGAWSSLLDRNEIRRDQHAAILDLAGRTGLRKRAFAHALAFAEYEFAKALLATTPEPDGPVDTRVMEAELAVDDASLAEALEARFLGSGDLTALPALIDAHERRGGWKAALPVAVDLMVLSPHDSLAAMTLLNLLWNARQTELLDAVIAALESNRLHPSIATLFASASMLARGNPGGCLKALGRLTGAGAVRPDVAGRMRQLALSLTAEALEKLADYRKAYDAYVGLKKADQGKAIDLDEFPRTALAAAALKVPALPPDARREAYIMTGFPRSGTTLLENALAAHPHVETFEEIPSWTSMQLFLDLELPKGVDPSTLYLSARERYYAEIDRWRKKKEARVLVDKMPILSASAGFMSKLFPEKRYIFSIRHPFDVALSCFKQQFSRNIAMEHFRTLAGAAKLYDFAMTQWFGAYSMDDERVHYLRYHDLVTDFEPSMRGALAFLGVDWDDSVLGFAERAEERSARTPSYQKVRQGLSIGVQSQWRNYGFLFQSAEAKPLYRWAEFFGYETK